MLCWLKIHCQIGRVSLLAKSKWLQACRLIPRKYVACLVGFHLSSIKVDSVCLRVPLGDSLVYPKHNRVLLASRCSLCIGKIIYSTNPMQKCVHANLLALMEHFKLQQLNFEKSLPFQYDTRCFWELQRTKRTNQGLWLHSFW